MFIEERGDLGAAQGFEDVEVGNGRGEFGLVALECADKMPVNVLRELSDGFKFSTQTQRESGSGGGIPDSKLTT